MTIRSLVGASEGYGGSRFSVISANPGVLDGDFESISTVNITASGTNILVISSIPQTYKHLQLRILTRILNGNNYADIDLTLNAGYLQFNRYILSSNGTSVSQVSNVSQGQFRIPAMGSGTTSNYGTHIIDFPDYTDTSKLRTISCFYGREINSSSDSQVGIASAYWNSTAAIYAIRLYALGDFGPGSTFALYGIKG